MCSTRDATLSGGTEEIDGTGKKLYRTFVSQDSCDFYKVYQELCDCIGNFVSQDLCEFYTFPSKTVMYQELCDCIGNFVSQDLCDFYKFPSKTVIYQELCDCN